MKTKANAGTGAIRTGVAVDENKKTSKFLTDINSTGDGNQRFCLRHRVQPKMGYCGLCESWRLGEKVEKARRIYIKKEYQNYLPQPQTLLEYIEYAEIG